MDVGQTKTDAHHICNSSPLPDLIFLGIIYIQAIIFQSEHWSIAEQLWLLEKPSISVDSTSVSLYQRGGQMVVELETVLFEDQLRKLGERELGGEKKT